MAIAAIMPKGTRMKSAIRMPIAMPLASGLRPGGTATSRVSHSSSFMVSSHRGSRGGFSFFAQITFCSIFWHPELRKPRNGMSDFQGSSGYNQHKHCTLTCSSLQQFCFHCLPVFSTRLAVFLGNTMENSGKQNPKTGFKPPPSIRDRS